MIFFQFFENFSYFFHFKKFFSFRDADFLLPHIFEFLLVLSYEKNQGTPVVLMSQICKLCESLMASELEPQKFRKFLLKVFYFFFEVFGIFKIFVCNALRNYLIDVFFLVLTAIHREIVWLIFFFSFNCNASGNFGRFFRTSWFESGWRQGIGNSSRSFIDGVDEIHRLA